jgi:hypothetical protein
VFVLVSGDQMKEDAVGRACSKHEGAAKCQESFGVKKKTSWKTLA